MVFKYSGDWNGDCSDENNWPLVCEECGRILGDHYGVRCPEPAPKERKKAAENLEEATQVMMAALRDAGFEEYNITAPYVGPQEGAEDYIRGLSTPHPLQETFDAVIAQVTKGKGERHGGGATPFFDQRWYPIAKSTGVGGLMFQAIKKAEEACEKPDQETFERELLGAIAYLGMAYLFVQKHGFRGKDKE